MRTLIIETNNNITTETMTQSNATFQAGDIYEMTFITDSQLRPKYLCTKRTAKTAWFQALNSSEEITRRISKDFDGNERIVDGSYSMAPSINSKRVVG